MIAAQNYKKFINFEMKQIYKQDIDFCLYCIMFDLLQHNWYLLVQRQQRWLGGVEFVCNNFRLHLYYFLSQNLSVTTYVTMKQILEVDSRYFKSVELTNIFFA